MTYPGIDPDKVMPSELYVGGATGSPTPSIFGPTRLSSRPRKYWEST